MENDGSSSISRDNAGERRIEPFRPKTDHNPRELRSWAKRTGFVSTFSIEATTNGSERNESVGVDLERRNENRNGNDSSPGLEIYSILGHNRANRNGTELGLGAREGRKDGTGRRGGGNNRYADGNENASRVSGSDRSINGNANRDGLDNRNGNVNELSVFTKEEGKPERDEESGFHFVDEEAVQERWRGPLELKLGLRESPGCDVYLGSSFMLFYTAAPLLYYGLQHYLSLAGSLIFIPLIIVPAMGGTDRDIASVISTMLMVSGITTILHSYFGTRLPLVQGSSFVFLAPALVVMNAPEYRNLTEHKFRHIMRELQGAIIVGSIFQCILGFSGLMSLVLRFINPVVVAPTVATIGLSFFSYGFPQAGSCMEISIPQIFLVLVFTLYLRGVSILGHRLFRIYAVPLSVMIIWIYAFFLTTGGAYNYRDCSPDIPTSNILTEACRKHAYTMQHCRTDVSNALRTASWVRIPYPLQWGFPIFHFRTSLIMIIASLVASVDSVGTYHSASSLVSSNPPTRGIVSRGIALEGFCSVLAALWGTGTGSTTLTENVHTIYTTKVANRKAVQIGALLMIFFSFIGKIGAILASIPQALAAAVLCFVWALIVALGLLTLRHTQAASFRNVTIVGVSLFLGLSIPAYFQQYEPESTLVLPNYFVPYAAASNGPFHTGNMQFDFPLNALMSLNMVVTLLVAFVLDNTVPGSRQERGVYIWSRSQDIETNPSLLVDYSLPRQISWICCRAKCFGA